MTPELLIADSKVAAVVSDPRLGDNPIIACNEAFMHLTGYNRDEIVGRNCRFLRGSDTEPEQTAMLREAVAEHRPVMVELINYKKDGTRFRNAVHRSRIVRPTPACAKPCVRQDGHLY